MTQIEVEEREIEVERLRETYSDMKLKVKAGDRKKEREQLQASIHKLKNQIEDNKKTIDEARTSYDELKISMDVYEAKADVIAQHGSASQQVQRLEQQKRHAQAALGGDCGTKLADEASNLFQSIYESADRLGLAVPLEVNAAYAALIKAAEKLRPLPAKEPPLLPKKNNFLIKRETPQATKPVQSPAPATTSKSATLASKHPKLTPIKNRDPEKRKTAEFNKPNFESSATKDDASQKPASPINSNTEGANPYSEIERDPVDSLSNQNQKEKPGTPEELQTDPKPPTSASEGAESREAEERRNPEQSSPPTPAQKEGPGQPAAGPEDPEEAPQKAPQKASPALQELFADPAMNSISSLPVTRV